MAPDIVDAGAAWFERSSPVGLVRACFSRARYVEFGRDLLAICDASVPSGPLHLRVGRLPPLVAGQALEVAEVVVDPGRRWDPAPIDPVGLDVHRELVPSVLGDVPSPFDAELTSGVRAALDAGDLLSVARNIGGRGPGLTPAGDDVLAGILVADAVGLNRFRYEARRDAAAAVPTTDVARAFLDWAARGQSIEPVHDLLASLAVGDPDAARQALRALRAVGASSGSDLAFGLGLGLSTGHPLGSTLTTSTSGPRASVFET